MLGIKNMLVVSEQSIAEIAYELSFENLPYFSRLFKKEVRLSLKKIKNQMMNQTHRLNNIQIRQINRLIWIQFRKVDYR